MSAPPPPASTSELLVVPASAAHQRRAERLAAQLGAALAGPDTPLGERIGLRVGAPAEPFELIPPGDDGPVSVDAAALAAPRRGRDPLLRAVRFADQARPTLIDATGGLGQDAFALAAAGCRVLLLERNPVLALLLADALERSARDPALAAAAARVVLHPGDALELLAPAGPLAADVIVLDPMYPATGRRARGRALTNKQMRLFRSLVGDDDDAERLLAAALRAAHRKVVVKRPARAAPLGGARPSGSIDGRTTRFDLYPAHG